MTTTDRHTALARLDAYARGAGDDDDALSAYEEDLFARALAGEAPELTFRSDIAATIRSLVSRGVTSPWITSREVARVISTGLKVTVQDLVLEGEMRIAIPRDADVFVTKLPLDLTGVDRLDIEVALPEGRVLKVMPEINFDPADGAIYACCDGDLARTTVGVRTVTRAFAVDARGERRLIAQSTVEPYLSP